MYKNIDSFTTGVCDINSTCVTIPIASLERGIHANHVYYASIKASNQVGLFVIATSNGYRHITQLPSKGVVFEVLSIDTNGGSEFSVSSRP